ncbi:LPXTG cell wall anchor domain-containing protein [Streptomyces sp. NPDC002262]|uniref:LPXTG cell wall anchor domain-containing protein n=1 Tax=Streptomyces sp. NPDC002262 TaxID=3154414 RepID=UPI0033309257
MRRSLIPAATLVAALAGSLALAPIASATGGKSTYELPLHQPTPITAAGFKQGECPDTIPADQDGWHFVIPGGGVNFVKLTVTFNDGAPIEITSFGPPKDDHAYVASEAGAKLTSAVAIVDGKVDQGFFNLSHTCAAEGEETTGGNSTGETSTGGTTTGGTTTGETSTGGTTTGGTTTGETTTGGTTTGETTTGGTTTGETTTGGTTTGETTTGETTTGESTATGETTATGGASATGGSSATGETTATGGDAATTGDVKGETDTKGGSEEGNLAETGAGAPIGVMAGVAAALAAAGAFLVMRRRKAAQN